MSGGEICLLFFENQRVQFHYEILTCTGIHNAAIADYQTVAGARVAELKVGVLNLHHGADQILLELVGCTEEGEGEGRRRYSLDSRRLFTIETNRNRNTIASKFESKEI